MSWNSKTWSWVKKYFSVNPLSTDGMPAVGKFRTPAPGSRPEKYTKPTTHASDVANNYYFQRDVRRNYPRLAVYSQSKVAGLLEGASAQASIPAGEEQAGTPAKVPEQKPLVEVLNTKKLYSQQNLAPTPTWGRQLQWVESQDFIHPGDPEFPMRCYTTV